MFLRYWGTSCLRGRDAPTPYDHDVHTICFSLTQGTRSYDLCPGVFTLLKIFEHHRFKGDGTNPYCHNVKLIRYQFWCTRCAFRLLKSLLWYSCQKRKSENNCENCIRAEKNQILCHDIEPNPSKDWAMTKGDNPFYKIYFFITCIPLDATWHKKQE
jgi:hypothetical protein